MNKATIGISSLVLLAVSIFGGIALTDDNVYYCEDRAIVMQCDKLSTYYELDNGKCWNSEIGNKLCKTGWLEVVDDTAINITQEHEGVKLEYQGREWECESTEPYSICMRDGTHKAYRYQINN